MDITNLKKEIETLLNSLYSKPDYDVMFKRASEDQELFMILWEIVKEKPAKDSWRVLWILDHATKKNNEFLFPILDELYQRVMIENNESFLRIGLSLILRCPVNEDYAGEMIDRCVEWMNDPKRKIATQAMALEFFYQVCVIYPEMAPELLAYIDEMTERQIPSAGLNVRIREIRKNLDK